MVAVVVTHDPGPWFEESLASLASQDYQSLAVLVLDAASTDDPSGRVAAVLPNAFVRRLEANVGFAASANEAISMVEGASHLLFCHDDVVLDPDVVHLMVEEAFRSNAGIVGPKFVRFDDTERLLEVGMAVDKVGAVVSRVHPGEIDHGQHDGVRDVFLVPGGCTLVRADLFKELGGFDAAITALGEHLDLCWRAQVAGARVVVAPQARVRHLELIASGLRAPPGALLGEDGILLPESADQAPPPTPQALQRRHELRAVLKAYSAPQLARVLPQAVVLSVGEMTVAALGGDSERAASIPRCWWWNIRRGREIRTLRAEIRPTRRLSDSEIRHMQLRGSARLRAYARRAVTHGMRSAHLAEDHLYTAEGHDAGPAGGRGGTERHVGHRLQAWVWTVAILALLIGTRGLIGGRLPDFGQIVPLPSWSSLLGKFWSGAQPAGLGSVGWLSPATGLLGVGSMLLLGSVGLLEKLVVLGCLPLGVLGAVRLSRPLGSARARLTTSVAYLVIPLPYDALARGRLDGLVAYAAAPWILALLARSVGDAPFSGSPSRRSWRRGLGGQVLGLGIIVALAVAFAPSIAVLVAAMGVGLAIGSLVLGGYRAVKDAARVLAVTTGGLLVAVALLAPWSLWLLGSGLRWQLLSSPMVPAASAPTWGGLLRLSAGPIGDTPLAWAFVAAGFIVLLIGSGWRLGWAARMWAVTLVVVALAWASGRGWTGALGMPGEVLLAGAGAALTLSMGLGVVAFETDLPGHRFGWRQATMAIGVAAAVIGTLPFLVAATGGRWDLPDSGYRSALSWTARLNPGSYRVLWLGDPRVLPGSGWTLSRGLSYELSVGLPDATSVWPGVPPRSATAVAADVALARSHSTARLGKLLAPYGVRYVVVVSSLAPVVPGLQEPVSFPPPAGLVSALRSQGDLRQVTGEGGYEVFVNPRALPYGSPEAVKGGLRAGADGWRGPALVGELVLWVVVVAALAGRRRWLDWWWVPWQRHKARRRAGRNAGAGVGAGGTGTDDGSVGDRDGELDKAGSGTETMVTSGTAPTGTAPSRGGTSPPDGPT